MASIPVPKERPPTTIDRFLGINESTSGDTQLQLGESPNMLNYRLTEDFKLRKRGGYEQLFASLGAFNIQGMWKGKLSGTEYTLFAANGNIYKSVDGVNTSIGTLTDAKTQFFGFGTKVYILNGNEYKSWDGTTFETVAGYIPVIATATPPSGGGTDNEGLNLLTGKKEQWFSPDGTATEFVLRESNLDSVDVVKNRSDGTVYVEGTDYTVNLVTGKVTFSVASTVGEDTISIQWTKGTGQRSEVTGHRFSMLFGGQNDTRVFFYGDGTNRYIYTGLADGVPSAEYSPALNYNEVGSAQHAITDIERQYDRQIIFTDGNDAHYSYYDTITDSSGNVIPFFPTFPLNSAIGNIAPGQGQVIQNNPFTIQSGVHEWVATDVRDERNEVYKSKRVQPSLDEVDLTTALTVDWEKRKEYWLAVGNKVWVYNYRLDAWYKFLLTDTPTCFYVINDDLHFGTTNGQIMRFDYTLRNDNGTAFRRLWQMNFYDFEAEWIRKFMNEMWMSLKPEDKTSVSFTYQTDREADSDVFTAIYNLATFENADFGNWSFLVNYNPQPFRFKIKAKKFVYFKLIFDDTESNQLATILSINLPIRFGSKVK